MFGTIFLPNFFLQAALRHQAQFEGSDLPTGDARGKSCGGGLKSLGSETVISHSAGRTPTGPTDKMSVLPIALIDEKEKKPVIIQLNPAAEAAGVSKGMTPSQGLARTLSLVIKTRSLSQEKSMQQIILHYAFSLSPFVEATGPGICTVQFTHDRELLRKVSHVIDQLAACEITAQAALAPTPDTSFLAAHLARPILEIKNAKDFLAPLSIDTLAIPFQS